MRNFDRLAPVYRAIEHAVFGGNLHRCRVAFVGRVADARRVLVLGEGDGRFLADFCRANPTAAVDVIDLSPGMVARARRRLGSNPRVRFVVADARTAAFPSAGYDLIVTNFFLDCFPPADLGPLVDRLAAALAPDGRWVVGDFRLPAGPAAVRTRSAAKLAVMYAFFRIATRLPATRLADPAPFLRAAGLTPVAARTWQGGFLVAELWRRIPSATRVALGGIQEDVQ